MINIANIAYTLIILIGGVIVLTYCQDILIPFILALIIWFLLKEVREFVLKIQFKGKSLPAWIRTLISTVLIFGVLGVVVKLLAHNIEDISQELPKYQGNIKLMTKEVNTLLGIDIMNWLEDWSATFDFSGILTKILNSLSSLMGNGFMVLLYTLFLIIEEHVFVSKLKALYPDQEDFDKVKEILDSIDFSLGKYVSLKTFVSLITGILSYIALLIINVDFALFWAFIIFILNYIPTIGSLIATVFPAVVALLQFASFGPCLAVLLSVGSIQLLVGNIIEPKIMGNSLNVSSLVVILALAFWGWLWGVTGMILCVPMTVMMVIVFTQFPMTRDIAIMMSEKGELE